MARPGASPSANRGAQAALKQNPKAPGATLSIGGGTYRPPGFDLGAWHRAPNLDRSKFAVTQRAGLYFARRKPGSPPGGAASGGAGAAAAPAPNPLADLTPWQQGDVQAFDARTQAQRDYMQRVNDAAVASAQADAQAGADRLKALAGLAGTTSSIGPDRQVSAATAALPGVRAQAAQETAVRDAALRTDTMSKIPTLTRDSGITALNAFLTGQAGDRMKLVSGYRGMNTENAINQQKIAAGMRSDNLNYLAQLAAATGRSDVAALAANARLGAAGLQADATTTAAATRADATTTAAATAAGARGAAGGAKATAAQRKLVAQWAGKVPGLLRGTLRSTGATTVPDPKNPGATVTTYTPGYVGAVPADQVYGQMRAAGLTPIQALNILDQNIRGGRAKVKGVLDHSIDPRNDAEAAAIYSAYSDAYNLVEQAVGVKRARAAFKRRFGIDFYQYQGTTPQGTGG